MIILMIMRFKYVDVLNALSFYLLLLLLLLLLFPLPLSSFKDGTDKHHLFHLQKTQYKQKYLNPTNTIRKNLLFNGY